MSRTLLGWEGERQSKWRECLRRGGTQNLMACCLMQEETGLEWQDHWGVWMGLAWVGRQGWREKLGTDCCIPALRIFRLFNLWMMGESVTIFTPSPPQVCWLPTVGPCYAATPTAPFYKPVLSFQEKEHLLFLTGCSSDLSSTLEEWDFIVI